jgi:hypothetical protein
MSNHQDRRKSTMTDDLIDERTEMARILGLGEPVPGSALRAALTDRTYANNLLAARRDPAMLRLLLANPPHRSGAEIPLRQLVSGAAAAFTRWAKTGFTVVDEATRARRAQACGRCPELTGPGSGTARRLLHTVSAAGLDDKTICGLCGCPIARKLRLASESCPAPHPDNPALTRWDHPRTDPI